MIKSFSEAYFEKTKQELLKPFELFAIFHCTKDKNEIQFLNKTKIQNSRAYSFTLEHQENSSTNFCIGK